MRTSLTLSQLVAAIAHINTEDDVDMAIYEIDQSYNDNKITWDDHENLFKMLENIGRVYY